MEKRKSSSERRWENIDNVDKFILLHVGLTLFLFPLLIWSVGMLNIFQRGL